MLSCKNTQTGTTVILLQRTIPEIIRTFKKNPDIFVCNDCGETVTIKSSPTERFAHKKYNRNCKFLEKRRYSYR